MIETRMDCTWENCPILAIIDDVGIDKFAETIKTEKKRAAGLLRDGACMVLVVQEFRGLRKTAKESDSVRAP